MGPLAIGLLAGGGLGLLKGKRNQERMADHDQYRKAAIQYSPWTGMGDPGSIQLPGMLESGISGAAMGGMVGSMMPAGAAPTANAPLAAGATGPTANALGGQTMAGKLGAQAANFEASMAPQMAAAGMPTATAASGAGSAGALGANSMQDQNMMKWAMLSNMMKPSSGY